MTDQEAMHRCRELAWQAETAGNTAVGSVVVLNGRIVGEQGETRGRHLYGGAISLPSGTVLVETWHPLPVCGQLLIGLPIIDPSLRTGDVTRRPLGVTRTPPAASLRAPERAG